VTVDPFTGSFNNTFSFVQGAFSGASGAVAGFDVVGDMVASFRVGVGAVSPVWSAWSPTAPVPSDINTGAFAFSQTYNSLTTGQTYWFQLAGSASEATYTVTLAPVPEPENWALMASGLALMGFVARRRRPAA